MISRLSRAVALAVTVTTIAPAAYAQTAQTAPRIAPAPQQPALTAGDAIIMGLFAALIALAKN